MWLVVGLGNPDGAYAYTRHNIGFMVLDSLSTAVSIPIAKKAVHYISGRGFIKDKKVLLIKPVTFMNRSGIAVREVLARYEGIEQIIVIHDDLDLEVGAIRIKRNGTSGGHRGVASIIDLIGTKDFIRLKIGIGRSRRISSENYVLSPFPKRERASVRKTVERAGDALISILTNGVSYAQNKYHSG